MNARENADQLHVDHLIGSPGVVHTIGHMLFDKLGEDWHSKAEELIDFATLQPPMRTIPCGPYEMQHRWTLRMVALYDPSSEITRCIVYDNDLKPEVVLERDGSGAKARFIVVYRDSDKWPEPGSVLQVA